MKSKKIIALLFAFSFATMAVGCSQGSKDSSADVSSQTSESADESNTESVNTDESVESSGDNSSSILNVQGDNIKKVYEFFQNDNYSCDVTLTNEEGEIIKITKVVRGDDLYQIQENSIGKSGYIKVDGQGYDFDRTCGVYRENNEETLPNMIESVVEDNLPQTNSRVNEEDALLYDVEEYTYTGDTYITILDFYFDKETHDLVKYTTTYSIEGQDDTSEIREYTNMTTEIDESVFDLSVATNLKNFDEMTDDVRLGYCQGVCATAGVTTDEMNEFGIDTDKLKKISYDDFVSLVYEYGYNGV